MNRKFCGVLVVLVAIFLGFLNLLTSMSADVPNPTEYSGDLLLDRNGKYNVPTIAMPKSTGTALRVMEYLFNKIPMCELIRHFFYKTTQFYRVRFLADQIKDAPRLGFPFKRLSPSELRRHEGREDMNLGDIKNKKQKFNSVLDFHELFKSNKSKPSIVLTQVLAHAKSIQSEYKPFKIIFANLEQLALESDKRFQNMKPLSIWDGVPIAVKDDFAVIGSSVSLGRDPAIAAFHVLAEQDDAVIAEFKRLGAIVIGVTVMHELAISAFGWNKHVSGPLNAWSKKHMAGGSSAGCGVVVAAGIVPVCIGTDSGGSIRIPAAWNGIFGLAPTFGRVQSTASSISHSTILHVGPMAATATDTALAYLLMASVKVDGHVYASEYGPNLPPAHLGTELASVLESKKNALQYLKTVKVGLFNDWIKDGTDPDILALFNQVVTKVFPNTIPFEIPHMYEQQLSHGIAFMSEAAFVHQQSFFNPKVFIFLPSYVLCSIGMMSFHFVL